MGGRLRALTLADMAVAAWGSDCGTLGRLTRGGRLRKDPCIKSPRGMGSIAGTARPRWRRIIPRTWSRPYLAPASEIETNLRLRVDARW